jgi:segregation and condensation protein B
MTEPHDVLEALLFASDTPVEAALIQDVLGLPSPEAARELVAELRRHFEEQGRVLQIIEAGGGYRMVTRPEVAPWLVKLARSKTKSRLSRPALETLAIIAYRQPVSRPEVDATRGVNSEGVLDSLLERRLVRIAGRKETAGRPFLYETTREFLVAFGLRDLGDLPKIDGELVMTDPSAVAETAVGDAVAESETPAATAGDGEMAADIAESESGATATHDDDSAGEMRAVVESTTIATIVEDPTSNEPLVEIEITDVAVITESEGESIADAAPPQTSGPASSDDVERPGGSGSPIDQGQSRETAPPAHAAPPDEDVAAATDPTQQDPRAGGTELTSRG